MIGTAGFHAIQHLDEGMAFWSQDDAGNDGVTGFLVLADDFIVPAFKEGWGLAMAMVHGWVQGGKEE
jgi:hypothetical protein